MALGSSLKFGTSGLRGLSVELVGQAARQYTAAFVRHLLSSANGPVTRVYLGRDYRPSSQDILADCAVAIAAAGLEPIDCGALPTPALALHALQNGGAAVMVTGSHIPATRNGLKFYLPSGEISKTDEAGITAELDGRDVNDVSVTIADEHDAATERYVARYAHLLPPGALAGKRVGVFEHSTVVRDILVRMLRQFGAEVVSLGRIDGFVPVDTEAFNDSVLAPLAGWITQHGLDAIVSSDGDGDRPLVMDEAGRFVRGDVLGLLAARFLSADCVVTPVTSNSGIEDTHLFGEVVRTRVGSPYVIAAMEKANGAAMGFEANGGTFVGSGIKFGNAVADPLVTRDAVLPILCVLGEGARRGVGISRLVSELPLRSAVSDRLQDVPSERSAAFFHRLRSDPLYARSIFEPRGIARRADIDGLQFWTEAGDMVHFRASGNAPELRCYVEAASDEAATLLLQWGLRVCTRELAL